MTYSSGKAVASYELDISQPRQAAAELRQLFQGIKTAASGGAAPALPGPDPQASVGIQQYIAGLRQVAPAAQAAASPIQQFVDDIRAQGAALGQTEEQINAHLAALSREALAANDVTRALQLEEAALGVVGQEEQNGTSKSLARASAEAKAALAMRDYAGAARILATDLQKQGERTVAVVNAERQLIQIEGQAAAAAQKQAREVQQAADAELRLAQVTARAQSAAGNKVGALQTLTTAQNNVVGASDRARASVDTQAASLERSSTIAGQFKAQLLGIVGPAALVAGGFALARGAVQSFGDAFKFKAALDETNASIKVLLTGVRNTNTVFDEARKFGDRYKLTQKETSEAIADSIPVIRASTSSIEDILSVFTRLTILKPGKTFNDASRAISELQSGNAVSLERIFNVPLDKANKLKEEIKGGADAVQVLNKFLAESGVGASALEVRTKGAAGALRDAAIAQEKLTLAQAQFAQGPGAGLISGYAQIIGTVTAAFDTAGVRAKNAAVPLSVTQSYGQYTAAVKDASDAARTAVVAGGDNSLNATLKQDLPILTEAQFNYAKSLIATGTAAEQAFRQAQDLNPTLIKIGEVQAQVGKSGELSAQGLDQLANAILHTAETGPAGVAATDGLIQAFLAGGITAEEFRQALIKLKQEHQEVQAAEERAKLISQGLADQRRGEIGGTADLASALDPLIARLSEEDRAKVTSKFDGLELAAAQKQLDKDSQLAAQGMLGAGDQATLLAAKYGKTRDQALLLIDAQRGVAAGIGALIDLQAKNTQQLTQPGGIGIAAPGVTSGLNNSVDAVVALQKANADAEAARVADLLKNGTATQIVAERQKEYNDAVKQFGPASAQAITAQTTLTDARQAASAADIKGIKDQIAFAKASGNIARARDLINQELAAARKRGDVGEQAQLLEELKSLGKTRVGAAASTALQLQNVEENSQLQLAKTQREGLERLRDQEADFTLHRVRSKEDEDRKIRGLLARGQIAQARREREDFAISQRRDQEDFNIQRQRTLRNNAESTGDINNRADLRQEQIGNRAALRGVRTNGGATLGGGVPPATLGGSVAAAAGVTTIQVNVQANTNLDGQKVGELIFEVIRQKLDDNFALELRSAPPPGAGQPAVAGARP